MADEKVLANKPLRVALAIPNEGHTLPEAYINRLLFAHHIGKLDGENPGKYEFFWENVGRVLTPLARERLAEWAVEMNADVMLQIDDDMIIPFDMFDKLYATMLETGADVVAPLAFMRVPPFYPVIYRVKSGYDRMAHKPYFEREFVKTYKKDAVVECDAVGFGSALIKVDLLRKMAKPWFMSTSSAGEDIWFCTCAKKEAKAKIVMDCRIKLGHMSNPGVITEEIYEQHNGVEQMREYA